LKKDIFKWECFSSLEEIFTVGSIEDCGFEFLICVNEFICHNCLDFEKIKFHKTTRKKLGKLYLSNVKCEGVFDIPVKKIEVLFFHLF
jgi:hypothetical protein